MLALAPLAPGCVDPSDDPAAGSSGSQLPSSSSEATAMASSSASSGAQPSFSNIDNNSPDGLTGPTEVELTLEVGDAL